MAKHAAHFLLFCALLGALSLGLSSCSLSTNGMRPVVSSNSQPKTLRPPGQTPLPNPGQTPPPTPGQTPPPSQEPPLLEIFDLSQATVLNSPSSVASWTETTRITMLEFRRDGIHLEFSKQDGPDRWPDVTPPGWQGPIQYTLWMALKIGGHWYTSGCIQFWYGLYESGGDVTSNNQVAINWFYDGRWGIMNGYQPRPGESVAFFVTAGNQRGATANDGDLIVRERSNAVVVPFPRQSGPRFNF